MNRLFKDGYMYILLLTNSFMFIVYSVHVRLFECEPKTKVNLFERIDHYPIKVFSAIELACLEVDPECKLVGWMV